MDKVLLIFISLLLTVDVSADPAPFGLEVGHISLEEVKKKYTITQAGINAYSKGEMYDLDVSEVALEGLQSTRLIFDQDGKLLAILSTLPKHKFDYLHKALSKKYQAFSEKIPFVGNKSVRYREGNTEITLSAPHMSFEMSMDYISESLLQSYREQREKKIKKKVEQETSQL